MSELTKTAATMPTVNLNGTDVENLIGQANRARKAVTLALDALYAAAPHGRDYQLAPGSYNKARREFDERAKNLKEIVNFYEDLVTFLGEARNDMARQKMASGSFRSQVIRLAHEKPELRGQLLPLLREATEKEAMRRFQPPRASYIPKDNPTLIQRKNTPEGLEIWTWEEYSKYFAAAFVGKADKPLWYNSFRDVNQQERLIQETVKDYEARVEVKRLRMEERKTFQHGLQIGDILVASWGYDQTNVNYFQITKLYDKAVGIREIGKKLISSDGSGSDKVMPSPNHFTGPEMKKIPRGYGAGYVSVKINETFSAHKWEGKLDRETSSGWGH